MEPIALSGPKYPISAVKGIAFEGGGVLGIGHVGALDELNKTKPLTEITHYAGSSAGAIIAMALACGADVPYIREMMEGTDFKRFNDDSWLCVNNLVRVMKSYGWYRGEALEEWLGSNLKKLVGHENVTLKELYEKTGKYLVVTMTMVEYPDCKTLYADHLTFPNLPVKVAVRRSAGIPGYFACKEGKVEYGDCKNAIYVDGGLLDNYPIQELYVHLSPVQVIGIKLISKVKIRGLRCGKESRAISSPIEFVEVIITSLRNQALKIHIDEDDWLRTIKVDVGTISAFNFELSDSEKRFLFEQGKVGVRRYLGV